MSEFAPYVVAKKISGEVLVYELSEVKAGIPIYGNPVTTEIRTEVHGVKLARYLTIGSQEDDQ